MNGLSDKQNGGEYEYIGEFREGLALVRNSYEEGKVGFINEAGEAVIPLNFYGMHRTGGEIDKFVNFPRFNEGLVGLMNESGQFGFIDKTGATVIPFEYDDAKQFENGLALVKKDGKWASINDKNEVIKPFEDYGNIDPYFNLPIKDLPAEQ
ncbi:MAG: WG repeat-containing protein [Oscillospiraceae bacterium]|jgi:hypothetical protein|nr:WG repeat-containing protein [Oscillospiraceae bacterium]